MKNTILTALVGLAGTVFADTADLSKYKWAVIGDSLSDPDFRCDCGHCDGQKYDHYFHFVARDTRIRVVYTNCVGSTGYKKTKWSDHDHFYGRLLDRPIPSDTDVVTIFGTNNDNSFAPWAYSAGRVTDSIVTTNTLAAYINAAIDVVTNQAPNAKIILITGLHVVGTNPDKHRNVCEILRKIAAYRCLEYVDWLTPNPSDPLDYSNITNREFAAEWTTDWQAASGNFGHPNVKYQEQWLAPHFTELLNLALTNPKPIGPQAVNLSKYKWAVIGDEYSDAWTANNISPWPKYPDIVSAATGIQIFYENAAATGYWLNNAKNNAFYQRIKAKPVPADTDVITIFGTYQDCNYDSTRYNDDPDVFPGEPGDRLPALTYTAYVNEAIDELVRQAPCAKIILVGPLYRQGPQEYYQKNFVSDMLAKVAAYRGIEYHNWYDGLAGDPLDFFQIKTDDAFARKYVHNYPTDGVAKKSWYGIPSKAYHEEFIGPQMISILSNALVGAGVPMIRSKVGSLQVVPWGASAVFYATVSCLGTGATAGDVYVAYGTEEGKLGEPVRIQCGVTGKVDAELKGLAKNTKYYYSLTFRNNAATPVTSAAITGSFTTTDELRPDWSAKKWALIGDSISDPTTSYNGQGVLPYYNFVARDTGIQVAYVSCIGSTGYAHDKAADPAGCPCFYKRLLNEKWRLPSDIDVVTIFGSANDKDWHNRVGSATDRFEDGKSSYSAYVNGTIDLVRQQAPNAQIVLISGFYGYGVDRKQLQAVTEALRAVAEFQELRFYDWATENPDDPYDIHQIDDINPRLGTGEGAFAKKYTIDWELWNIGNCAFGHPNTLYHEVCFSPRFRAILTTAFEDQPKIKLGESTARPGTDYNGSVVSIAFTGDIPEGSVASAKVTVGGVDYAGTFGEPGTCFFTLPAEAVAAGKVYDGTITVTLDGRDYMKPVTLTQAAIVIDENAEWICESASTFGSTGAWTGGRAEVVDGKICVSNATFTAAKPSREDAVVTVTSTCDFGGANEDAFDPTALGGVKVVTVGKEKHYAFLTGAGVVTNFEAVANVRSTLAVTARFDFAADEISYMINDRAFGPFPAVAASKKRISGVTYEGTTSISTLKGSYRYEGLNANLAKANEAEYATVAEALAAAGSEPVTLLWDASWVPEKVGDYRIAKGGYSLVIGGDLAYSVKDNGDGTVTVSVAGGEPSEAPASASITFSGSKVLVGVSDVKPDLWYALEKTTDLTKDFVVDESTWTKGSDLIGGDKELAIMLRANEPQAFYRVVVSKTAKP